MTLCLAHLSDLHFGEASPALVERLMRDVRDAAPDAVLVSGDLTRRARSSEFAAASEFLVALGRPVLSVPGNHDIPPENLWRRFVDPMRGWSRFHGANRAPVLDLGAAVVLGLDTVRRAHWHLDWSAGGISRGGLARLATRLAAQHGRRILLVCHHPLRHPSWAPERHPPFGAAAALTLLREAGAEAILSGHLHRAETTAAEAGRPIQIIAPAALSPRTKGSPNGWNLLRLGPVGLTVETRWLGD